MSTTRVLPDGIPSSHTSRGAAFRCCASDDEPEYSTASAKVAQPSAASNKKTIVLRIRNFSFYIRHEVLAQFIALRDLKFRKTSRSVCKIFLRAEEFRATRRYLPCEEYLNTLLRSADRL